MGEVVGKGSYGVVCSAIDNFTGEAVHGGGGSVGHGED